MITPRHSAHSPPTHTSCREALYRSVDWTQHLRKIMLRKGLQAAVQERALHGEGWTEKSMQSLGNSMAAAVLEGVRARRSVRKFAASAARLAESVSAHDKKIVKRDFLNAEMKELADIRNWRTNKGLSYIKASYIFDSLDVGDHIEGKKKGWSLWYPGIIMRMYMHEIKGPVFDVRFADTEMGKALTRRQVRLPLAVRQKRSEEEVGLGWGWWGWSGVEWGVRGKRARERLRD